MTQRTKSLLWLGGSLLGLFTVLFWTSPSHLARARYALQAQEARAAEDELASAQGLSRAFQNVAKSLKPSVVNISSVKVIRTNGRGGLILPPGFRDFFGDDAERFFGTPPVPEGYTQSGQGTGVIVSADGHVLTNNHVVADADEVTVTLSNNEKYTAEVVGRDPRTDIAVIKIQASGLHPARLGDSDAVEVGEWVLAMGSPYGLAQTLTAGIVSAKGRNVGIVNYEDFIQTDAAINPGNSGGPLINLRGEVIGINTAIFSRSGGYQGIGFAIPIKMAKQVMESLLKEGKVVRGYLGVLPQDLTPRLSRSFDFKGTSGALVAQVMPGTPAAKAGLREGDIITEVNGKPITNTKQLREYVATIRPGTTVPVEVVREGKKQTLEVTVAELESNDVPPTKAEESTHLGMKLETLTSDLARSLRQDESLRGVVVTAIEPLGVADKAGLERGDVILSVQGVSVESTEGFQREIHKHDLKQGVRLKVRRGPGNLFVFLEEK